MSALISQLSHAFRQLRRQPRFLLAALAAIGLGVAAVTTVFALIESTLLRPLAVPSGELLLSPHRLDSDEADISLPDARNWRRELKGIDAFAVVSLGSSLDWVRATGPLHVNAGLTESEYFRALGAPPLAGRLLEAGDDANGADPVVVLSERFWRREFAADPAVLGRVLDLSGVAARIVGVATQESDLWDSGIDVWAPLPPFAPWADSSAGSNNFEVIARRRADVSLAAAQAEFSTVNQRLIDSALIGEHKRLAMRPTVEMLTRSTSRGLWLVLSFAGLVLLLAGVNIAALLLLRLSSRRTELRVRHALGADQGQIRRQLRMEALILGGLGGALGLLVALLAFQLLRLLAADALPRLGTASPGWATWLFAPLCALLTCLLFSRLSSSVALRQIEAQPELQRSVGRIPLRLLSGFVVLEVGLAVLLLCGSALLLRSFQSLSSVTLGFEPTGVLTAALALPESRYSKPDPQSAAIERMVAALQSTPGVRSAGYVVGLPLASGGTIGHSLVIESAAVQDRGASFRPFHGDYFEAAGLQLLAGRAPQPADLQPGERLAWVNQRFVDRYLPGQAAIGQRIAWTPGEAAEEALGPQWMRIVGVVANTRSSSLREDDSAAVYAPYLQRDDPWIRFGQLVVKVEGAPYAWSAAMQDAVSSVDPTVALSAVMPWQDHVDRALRPSQLQLWLACIFAGIAAALGLQGIVGVVAFVSAQRQREMGLRMALGASAGALLRSTLSDGMRQVALGTVIGAGGAWLLARSFSGLLYGVSPGDPLSYSLVVALSVGGGLLAIWWPARTVLRLDPQQVLRSE